MSKKQIKIDIDKEFDELFEEFKSVHKLPERKKNELSIERIKQLEYCEAVYGRDFLEWQEKKLKSRYHTQEHHLVCNCGEKYTLYIEPEYVNWSDVSGSEYSGSVRQISYVRKALYSTFFCFKCGCMMRYTGKLKHISNERGNFEME